MGRTFLDSLENLLDFLRIVAQRERKRHKRAFDLFAVYNLDHGDFRRLLELGFEHFGIDVGDLLLLLVLLALLYAIFGALLLLLLLLFDVFRHFVCGSEGNWGGVFVWWCSWVQGCWELMRERAPVELFPNPKFRERART
jgi:hypothetical protein